jgi:hypothetical protein
MEDFSMSDNRVLYAVGVVVLIAAAAALLYYAGMF